MDKEAVTLHSSLSLAFLGDAVYELEIRSRLMENRTFRPSALSRTASRLVCAAAQAELAAAILPQLTEEEEGVFRRGRNAHPKTMAKHQSMSDYRQATGLEALFGYLHLTGQAERIRELIGSGLKTSGLEKWFEQAEDGISS